MKCLIGLLFLVYFASSAKDFFIPNVKANWHKAQEFCTTLGMSLVTVDSKVDHDALVAYISRSDKFAQATRFWLGASDLAEEGSYSWIGTGGLTRFTNWAEGEPNDANGTENCIEMIHNTYIGRVWQWNDIHCRNFQAYFICEKKQCIAEF